MLPCVYPAFLCSSGAGAGAPPCSAALSCGGAPCAVLWAAGAVPCGGQGGHRGARHLHPERSRGPHGAGPLPGAQSTLLPPQQLQPDCGHLPLQGTGIACSCIAAYKLFEEARSCIWRSQERDSRCTMSQLFVCSCRTVALNALRSCIWQSVRSCHAKCRWPSYGGNLRRC